MNLLTVYQRACRYYLESNGRVPFKGCWERAAMAVRNERRA